MKLKIIIPDNTLGLSITMLVQAGIYDIKMQTATIPTDELKKGEIDLVKLIKEQQNER